MAIAGIISLVVGVCLIPAKKQDRLNLLKKGGDVTGFIGLLLVESGATLLILFSTAFILAKYMDAIA